MSVCRLRRGLAGLEDVVHVIADAAYASGLLREEAGEDRGAEARIRAKPSRAIKPSLGPHLYAGCYTVESVFQRIKRFCRITRRCEKPMTSFGGSVFLAAALDWLR